jgi:ribosomal-protein-alanine N-acetyltransferase
MLYRHFGFQQIGVRRGYYPADKGREEDLVLTHALEEVLA